MESMTISAIIPVYNCAKTIGNVLDCLFAAIPPEVQVEVIVVDDASTDDTADICKQYPLQLIRLTKNHGPAYCRNFGVQKSKNDILWFLDSDIEFQPHLLEKMLSTLEETPNLAGIYTLTSPEPLNMTFTSRYFALQEYLRFMNVYEQGCTTWSFISTRCGLVSRNVFEETGGFNENFALAAYEDLEFSCRMSDIHQFALHPDFIVQHYWPNNILKMLKRLHINARGVMGFSAEMRKKASVPFVKDRNARALTGISWVLIICTYLWWPIGLLGILVHLSAMQQASWLLIGCMRNEGLFFTIKAWGTYNLTLFPFATGVGAGFFDQIGKLRPAYDKKK